MLKKTIIKLQLKPFLDSVMDLDGPAFGELLKDCLIDIYSEENKGRSYESYLTILANLFLSFTRKQRKAFLGLAKILKAEEVKNGTEH